MSRALVVSMIVAAVLALPSAAAAKPKLPHGTVIAGVVVGDLGPRGATAKLKEELEPVYGRRISVRAGGSRTSVSPAQAGQVIRYELMVNRAYKAMAAGQVVIDIPLARTIRRKQLTGAVNSIAGKWYRAPRNA